MRYPEDCFTASQSPNLAKFFWMLKSPALFGEEEQLKADIDIGIGLNCLLRQFP